MSNVEREMALTAVSKACLKLKTQSCQYLTGLVIAFSLPNWIGNTLQKKYIHAYIDAHAEIKEWLQNRPENTQRSFARRLKVFTEAVGLQPEDWRNLPRLKARDLVWKYIVPQVLEHSNNANTTLMALKSFYRYKDGEELPFDTSRGGKHYFKIRRIKSGYEHIPNKSEVYQLVDMAGSLRAKAILLFVFHAGVRVNVVQHLTYGHVADQFDSDLIILKVTGDLDFKLRSRDIPYYYTCVGGEALSMLKRYCKRYHSINDLNMPLFCTKANKPMSQNYVLRIVKMSAARAGFDPKTMWTHTLRKAFRKVVRQAPDLDDDDREQLMGHVIKGTRDAYFDKKDTDLIKQAYQKCNFSRELDSSELKRLQNELEKQKMRISMKDSEVEELKNRMNALQEYIETVVKDAKKT